MPRSRRGPGTWALATAAALGLPLSGWLYVADSTADRVLVSWDAVPRCEGTTVHDWEGRYRALVEARAGMTCVVTVVVTNESSRTVHVDRAVASELGPGGGEVLRVEPRPERADDGSGDDRDAYVDLNEDLAPGGSTTMEVAIGFREEGCSGGVAGGIHRLADWPIVEVEVFGVTKEARPSEDFIFAQKDVATGC